jgi:hypothetical protein
MAGSPGKFAIRTTSTAGRITERGALPPGLTFRDGAPGAAAISGVAADGSGAAYSITLIANDPAGTATRQRLALIVDQSPRLSASSTSQVGMVSGHLTFGLTATGYPAPRITLSGKLPSSLVFRSRPGAATISGHLDVSWIKAALAGALGVGSVIAAIFTGGSSALVEFGVGAGVSAARSTAEKLVYTSPKITAIASNGIGKPSTLILTLRILGPN